MIAHLLVGVAAAFFLESLEGDDEMAVGADDAVGAADGDEGDAVPETLALVEVGVDIHHLEWRDGPLR